MTENLNMEDMVKSLEEDKIKTILIQNGEGLSKRVFKFFLENEYVFEYEPLSPAQKQWIEHHNLSGATYSKTCPKCGEVFSVGHLKPCPKDTTWWCGDDMPVAAKMYNKSAKKDTNMKVAKVSTKVENPLLVSPLKPPAPIKPMIPMPIEKAEKKENKKETPKVDRYLELKGEIIKLENELEKIRGHIFDDGSAVAYKDEDNFLVISDETDCVTIKEVSKFKKWLKCS